MKKYLHCIALFCITLSVSGQDFTNRNVYVRLNEGTKVVVSDFTIDGEDPLLINNSELIVCGDFSVSDGSRCIFSDDADLVLRGPVSQNIQSSGTLFSNVKVENSSSGYKNVVLSDDITITKSLILTQGILYASGNTVNFGSASESTVGNTESFIDGKITKRGRSLFMYPSGRIISENEAVWAPIAIQPDDNTEIELQYIGKAPEEFGEQSDYCVCASNSYIIKSGSGYSIEQLPYLQDKEFRSEKQLTNAYIENNNKIGIFADSNLSFIESENIYLNEELVGFRGTEILNPSLNSNYIFSVCEKQNEISDISGLQNGNFTVYPNPFKDAVLVKATNLTGNSVKISIYNTTGTEIFTKLLPVSDGEFSYTADLSRLVPAMYYMVMTCGDEISKTRIVKQ